MSVFKSPGKRVKTKMILCFTLTLVYFCPFALFPLNKLLLSALVSYICQSEDIIGYAFEYATKISAENVLPFGNEIPCLSTRFSHKKLVVGGPNCQ